MPKQEERKTINDYKVGDVLISGNVRRRYCTETVIKVTKKRVRLSDGNLYELFGWGHLSQHGGSRCFRIASDFEVKEIEENKELILKNYGVAV